MKNNKKGFKIFKIVIIALVVFFLLFLAIISIGSQMSNNREVVNVTTSILSVDNCKLDSYYFTNIKNTDLEFETFHTSLQKKIYFTKMNKVDLETFLTESEQSNKTTIGGFEGYLIEDDMGLEFIFKTKEGLYSIGIENGINTTHHIKAFDTILNEWRTKGNLE